MKQIEKWISRITLFEKWSVLYVFLLGLLLFSSERSYSQSYTVLYSNVDPPNHIPMEAYYIGDGRSVGYIFTTGTNINGVKLNQVRFSLWNSSTVSLLDFKLEISEAYYEAQANPGDPVILHSNLLYQQTFSKFVDTNYDQLNTGVTLNTPFTLIGNRRYIVSIRQTSNIGSAGIYLRTHNLNSSGSVTLYPNLNSSSPYFKYANGSNWESASLESQYITFELIGSLPNASVTTASISNIQHSSTISATSGGNNVSQADSEITAKGICWSTLTNPTLSNDFTNEGAGTTDYTSTLTNLLPNTTYYVRAYVTDATGTYYGSETSFSTNRAPVITSGSGLNGASVTISENTTAITTIQATDADVPAQNLTYSIQGGADASKFTINSATGVVAFVTAPDYESPTDSDTNNTYIVEVKVTDNGSIAKSATQTITVTVSNVAEIPTITDANSLTVGITGGTLTGTVVTNGGGGAISERGFIYAPTSVNANPIIGGTGTTKVVVNGTIGNFTKAITGLSANTSYSFKAFATNTTGSGYSEAVTFTTNGLTAGPNISYENQTLQQNIAITPITPTNVGTAIPMGNYSKVTTFAGSSEGNTNDTNPLMAKFNAPMGMVMDASRNIYFTDSYNHRIKKIDGTTGAVTQIAGQTTPTPFLANDNGSNDGTGIGNARFDQPSGLTYDGQGILYIADRGNNKIRKLVIATGAVSTIAGGGTGSQSGYTDATGTAARFLRPTDVLFKTESGTSYLYVADAGNHCIRKINLTTNAVTTFAGSNTSGTNEGNLTSARFNNPTGLAFSSTGILYVVDRGNQKIRKIESGTVSTFAGSGTNATTNGTGTAAAFADPYGIAIDGGDNLYITQALDGSYPSSNPGFSASSSTNNYIRKITPSGVVSNFIGSGTKGTTANDNGLLATLSSPAHLLFDSNQKYMYVSEWYGDDIRKVEITGYTISPSLPSGLSFDNTTGNISGTPAVATSTTVYAVSGNNYYGTSIANFNITVGNLPTITTNTITSITSSTAVSGGNASSNGGIALIEKGICWSTTANPTINDNKLVDGTTATGTFTSNLTGLNALTTYYVRAYATNSVGTSYGDQISFTTTVLPPIISYNSNNVFTLNSPIVPLQVTNTGGPVNTTTGVITIAGTGVEGVNDGLAFQSTFSSIDDLFCDKFGEIFIADNFASYGNRKLRKLDISGNVSTLSTYGYGVSGIVVDELGNYYTSENYLSTIYKNGLNFASTSINGVSFSSLPGSLTIDLQKNVYFSDPTNKRIGKVSPSGIVSTFVGGAGLSGYVDGHISTAKMTFPTNLTSDGNNIYFVDANIGRIRKIDINANNVSTIAGSGQGGYLDGPIATARIGSIEGLAVDKNGDIYFLDHDSTFPRIRKISNGKISTIVANGSNEYLDGSLDDARFTSSTKAMTIDANGDLYVADSYRIRKIMLNKFKVSPDLPAGLVLNSDGSISGTPTVLTPANNYTITALNSTGTSSYTISIAVENGITTVNAPTASPQTFCSGATVSDLVATGTDLKWYSAAEGGVALNTATVLTGTTYYVSQTLSGNESARTAVVVTITPTVGSIGSISGSTNLASTATVATYSVTPVSGATSYVWALPSGMILISQTGPSITVGVSSTFTSGSISVYAMNGCSQTSVRTISVRKSEVPVGGVSFTVSGSPVLCSNATGVYTATSLTGGSYVWEVPNGITITSGQGSNEINVSSDSNFTSGVIRAKFITSSYTLDGSYTVSGVTQPSVMSGPIDLCGLTTATYSVTQVSGVSYVWSVPSGMTIIGSSDSSSIAVSITGVVSGNVSVRAQNACGLSTARSLFVKSTPIMGWISGATRVCGAVQATVDTTGAIIDNTPSDTYTYSVVASAGVSYFWTVPSAATIVSGQNTNSITVRYDLANFDSGSITVQGTNSCGVGSPRSLAVSAVTGIITGPTSLCSLTTATYSVPSDLGTIFTWSLPEGMSISSGQGTSSITVSITHPIKFNTDNRVRVQFTTGCGGTRILSLGVSCSDYTNLTSDYCGATSIDPYQWIYATEISTASEYRFNVYDATGSTLLFTVNRNVPYFRFFGNSFTYGGTYQVKVQVKPRLGVFGVEGSSCNVTLQNVPTTALQATHCGSSVNPYQWLYASQVAGASGYRFTIYDATGTDLLFTIDSSVSYFRFLGSAFSYGSTYQVRVQAKQGEVYGTEGSSCSITLSGIPTTSINATHCGSTVTPYQWMFASQVAGATEYRFNIYDSTGTNLLFSIDRNVAYFRFFGSSFIAGTTYSVGVQAKQGGVYSTEGSRCSITLSGPPTTSIANAQCGATVLHTDAIYATAVTNATGYKFNVYDVTGTTLVASYESVTNSFSFSQLTGYAFDTTYQVRVQVIRGTEYGVEGTACSITVLKDAPARALSNQDEIKSSIISEFKAYPNPFTTTFSITPIEGETATLFYQVYDVTGKMMESRSVEANEITNHTIGEQYPAGVYLVIVRQGATTQTFKMVKQ